MTVLGERKGAGSETKTRHAWPCCENGSSIKSSQEAQEEHPMTRQDMIHDCEEQVQELLPECRVPSRKRWRCSWRGWW